MKVRILAEAEEEAREAALWYEERQHGLGIAFHDKISDCVREIASNPHRFARIKTVKTDALVRRARISRFPYTVVFKEGIQECIILAVAHTSRRPEFWSDRTG